MEQNSLFLNPQIFFGTSQKNHEEDAKESEVFSIPWQISFDTETPFQTSSNIGLFFDWTNISE